MALGRSAPSAPELANRLALALALHDGRPAQRASVSASQATLGAAVRAVIGNGPGLTPAGDDVLVGAMLRLALAAGEDTDAAATAAALSVAVRSHLHATNDISAHLLQLACNGWFSRPLVDLVSAPASQVALHNVLAVGATSGADALIGLSMPLDPLPSMGSLDPEHSQQGVLV